jgi:hypothetical protein
LASVLDQGPLLHLPSPPDLHLDPVVAQHFLGLELQSVLGEHGLLEQGPGLHSSFGGAQGEHAWVPQALESSSDVSVSVIGGGIMGEGFSEDGSSTLFS